MKSFKLCPGDKCKHFSHNIKYDKKCFYEPQCWRGKLDIFFFMFTLLRWRQK